MLVTTNPLVVGLGKDGMLTRVNPASIKAVQKWAAFYIKIN